MALLSASLEGVIATLEDSNVELTRERDEQNDQLVLLNAQVGLPVVLCYVIMFYVMICAAWDCTHTPPTSKVSTVSPPHFPDHSFKSMLPYCLCNSFFASNHSIPHCSFQISQLKIEMDSMPSDGGDTEERLLLQQVTPHSCACLTQPLKSPVATLISVYWTFTVCYCS